jgi:hypothetical protein
MPCLMERAQSLHMNAVHTLTVRLHYFPENSEHFYVGEAVLTTRPCSAVIYEGCTYIKIQKYIYLKYSIIK